MPKNTYSGTLDRIANSARKQEVVHLLARGFTVPEMAAELGLGQRTVKSHIEQMRLAFGGVPRREIPRAWFVLTGENPYPNDAELEVS